MLHFIQRQIDIDPDQNFQVLKKTEIAQINHAAKSRNNSLPN